MYTYTYMRKIFMLYVKNITSYASFKNHTNNLNEMNESKKQRSFLLHISVNRFYGKLNLSTLIFKC